MAEETLISFRIIDSYNDEVIMTEHLPDDSLRCTDFLQFCYRAGIAYGFNEEQLRGLKEIAWEY